MQKSHPRASAFGWDFFHFVRLAFFAPEEEEEVDGFLSPEEEDCDFFVSVEESARAFPLLSTFSFFDFMSVVIRFMSQAVFGSVNAESES